jgi:hypothetical protein
MSLLQLIGEVLRLPRVKIRLGSDPVGQRLFRAFNKPHPRFKFIKNKSIGVALLDLTEFASSDAFLEKVNGKNSAAYFSRKAQRAGYDFRWIDPDYYADDIQAIHLSTDQRQGIPLDKAYHETIRHYPTDESNAYFGVFKEDRLTAYLWVVRSGDLVLMNRIMGHAAHLKEGVMYLLVTSFIVHEIGNVHRGRMLMYDTMLGATSGLRMFKERFGFRAMYVKWEIADD